MTMMISVRHSSSCYTAPNCPHLPALSLSTNRNTLPWKAFLFYWADFLLYFHGQSEEVDFLAFLFFSNVFHVCSLEVARSRSACFVGIGPIQRGHPVRKVYHKNLIGNSRHVTLIFFSSFVSYTDWYLVRSENWFREVSTDRLTEWHFRITLWPITCTVLLKTEERSRLADLSSVLWAEGWVVKGNQCRGVKPWTNWKRKSYFPLIGGWNFAQSVLAVGQNDWA